MYQSQMNYLSEYSGLSGDRPGKREYSGLSGDRPGKRKAKKLVNMYLHVSIL